jgi:hypothetical protein
MFTSRYRQTSYKGLLKNASAGLHADAFTLFRKYVSSGAKVLYLGRDPGAWLRRFYGPPYLVTAYDFKVPNTELAFPYLQVD